MSINAILITLALVLPGAWLLILGLRGRKLTGVRECRKCRYATTPAAQFAACAECGADLSAPKAVRVRRVRSRPRTVVGSMLLVVGLAVTGASLWSRASNFSLWPRLSAPILALALDHGPASISGGAAAEYRDRIEASALSKGDKAQLAGIVAGAIDSEQAWNPLWDPLVVALRADQLIADEPWALFLEESLRFEMLAPAKARPGSWIQYGFTHSTRPFQFGQLRQFVASMRFTLSALRIGGQDIDYSRRVGMNGQMVIDGGEGSTVTQLLLSEIPPGPSTIEAEFRFEILDGHFDSDKVLVTKTLRLTKPITIVGKDDPILEVVRDASLREAFRSAITLRSAKVRLHPNKRCMVDLSFHIGQTPVGAAFRVFLRRRDGGAAPREFELLPLAITGANPVPNRGLAGFVDEFAPGRYDIVLRPSLEHAEVAVGLTRVWLGEDIVIEDVELTLEGISEPASPSPE